MNGQADAQLLRAYAETRSDVAFNELVRRHVDFVYSAARRMVCDPHLAEDVTQDVFVALAASAGQLIHRPVLSGWLHRTAQNIAAQTVRTIERRRAREKEAAVMNELLSADSEVSWEHIAPHLDAALGELSEPDRDALFLRYFERKSARDMAATLGVSDEAAQKRVHRAAELALTRIFSADGSIAGWCWLPGRHLIPLFTRSKPPGQAPGAPSPRRLYFSPPASHPSWRLGVSCIAPPIFLSPSVSVCFCQERPSSTERFPDRKIEIRGLRNLQPAT